MRMAKAEKPRRPAVKQQWAEMHPDLARQADALIERQHKRASMPPLAADKHFAFVPPYRSERDKDHRPQENPV